MDSKTQGRIQTHEKLVSIPFGTRKRKSTLWLHKPKLKKSKSEIITTPTTQPINVKPNSSQLTKAPRKHYTNKSKVKRKLFQESYSEALAEEISALIPSVLKIISQSGMLTEFCAFIRLISSRKFPLSNISFRLLMDAVRWYSLGSTTTMTYSRESLKFWKVVYRLFHGKALRFLSGLKSSGQVVSKASKKGVFRPEHSKINFAVPSRSVLVQFKPTDTQLPDEVPPGVIKEAISIMDAEKSYVLSVDGKKLAPGLSRDKGDIDLFGFEESESLQSTKDRIKDELNKIENARSLWASICDSDKISKVKNIVKIVSSRIQNLREVHVKQVLALKRFEKEGGTDWRNSKYVYAISSIQAYVFQLKTVIHRLLDINNDLLEIASTVNNTCNNFVSSGTVDSFSNSNWITLKSPGELSESCSEESAYIKQTTDEWFGLRSKFKVTGSKLYQGVGLDTLKSMNAHIDAVNHPERPKEPPSALAAANMAHGVASEIHAVATLVGKILPIYYPELKYIEEGAHIIYSDGTPLILVSPDGSIGHIEMSSSEIHPRRALACEFKCPVPAIYKTPVHYSIPERYIPQVLGEMASMNLNELIYLCWTSESSTVFRITFDDDLWMNIKGEVEVLYSTDNIKKSSRLSERSKEIKCKLGNFSEKNVTFLCEVPSLCGSANSVSQTNNNTPFMFPVSALESQTSTAVSAENVFYSVSAALEEAFQLSRKKATEVLVWLLSDTDRNWNPEVPHSLPVAYAMKGYSLSTDIMRNMHSHILDVCAENKINVSCSCFDGQWLRLATRDRNKKPLTKIQLQRDVWETASKESRSKILNDMSRISLIKNFQDDVTVEKYADGALSVTCNVLSNMMQSYKQILTKKRGEHSNRESDNICVDSDKEASVTTVQCLPVDALEAISENENMINDLVEPGLREITITAELNHSENVNNVNTEDNQNAASVQIVNDTDLVRILDGLQNHEKVSISNSWKEKTLSHLKELLHDSTSVHKFTHEVMNVMIKATENVQKSAGFIIRKSWRHVEKANGICKLLGSGIEIVSETMVKKVFSLQECASKVVNVNKKKLSKDVLNSVYAAFTYREMLNKWENDNPFRMVNEVEDVGTVNWFSYPEYNEKRNRIEPKCVDAHHLLVNLRAKVCKDGVRNIKKQAWHSVAESNSNIISKALVVDLIDRQSNAFTLRTFSENVEKEMRRLNFIEEATFCNIIRNGMKRKMSPVCLRNKGYQGVLI